MLIDIHAHPAMNAFLWGRHLRRHYWTGPVHTFNPLASLSDFRMLEQAGSTCCGLRCTSPSVSP